tara:strand:- start:1166 stop:1369 length:204 start_codon:yes stop_codon:yes gene_type:complete
MSNTLTVNIKTVYGELRFYPVNEQAQIFAAISGHKTLTPHTIAQAKQLGYEVVEAKSDILSKIGSKS